MDYYIVCKFNMLSVHSNHQFPSLWHKFGYGSSLEVLITPSIMKTDEELRKVAPTVRRCLFDDERKLIYHNYYTKASCQLECKAFVMYKTCNCIPFNMPRNDSMTLCDIAGMDCIFSLINMPFSDYDHLYKSDGVCGCLDDCNSIEYDIEFVNLKFDKDYNSR
jgi:hypothetical protein